MMTERTAGASSASADSLGHGPAITFEGVSKVFGSDAPAVEDLSFTVEHGELVAVVGVTGCGKSTAFNLILGLLRPTTGSVRVFGRDPQAEFGSFRRQVAVVFQDARLLPWRTALQNVCVAMKFAGVEKSEWEPRARDWLARLGLAGRETAYPHQLSGGQRQRVAIARAFALDPELILCDESFSALDEATAANLRREFTELVRANHKTGVVITHSIPEAIDVGDRIFILRPPGHLVDVVVPDRQADAAGMELQRVHILERMVAHTTLQDAGSMGAP